MNKPHACDTVREMVFNYRRGELSELDEALFEESLDECPECARYVERILDMLTVSAEAAAEDYLGEPITPAFADDLFASIVAGVAAGDERTDDEAHPDAEPLEVPSTSGAPPVRLEFGLASAEPDLLEDEELAPVAPRWPRAVAAAAALLLVATTAWFGRGAMLERPGPDAQPELAATDEPDEGSPEDEDAALERAFADLERSPDRVEAVEVFASGGARWHLESRPPEHTLHLERGTVLVEFVPRGQETLRVISGGTEVDVVGTVFYVSTSEAGDDAPAERAQPARVGVITGEVKVRQRSAPEAPAQEVTLREGQELAPDRDVQPIEESTRERSRELIDLRAHHAALARHARHRAQPPAPREDADATPAPTPEPEVEPAPVEEREAAKPGASARPDSAAREKARLAQLSQRARRAIRDRDYAGAARQIERLLDQLPPGHFERATWRLELARLYTRNLSQRDKAIEHLREFVAQHPSRRRRPQRPAHAVQPAGHARPQGARLPHAARGSLSLARRGALTPRRAWCP